MTRRQAVVLSLGGSVAAQARPQDSLVRWSPRPLFNGAPVLFESKASSGVATWLDKKIEFRPDGEAFSALAGVNLNRAPGRYPLALGDQTVSITVVSHAYASATITVPQKFVEPPKEVRARIDEEIAIKENVFRSSGPNRLWHGPFIAPANTPSTSSFGLRRIYNGRTRSVHQGLDYSAALGTQVTAANAGRVEIARDMYFEGGF